MVTRSVRPETLTFSEKKDQFLYRHRQVVKGYAFISPYILFFLLTWLFPLVYAVWLSFHEFETLYETPRFVGLENFAMLLKDDLYIKSYGNVGRYMLVQIPLTLILSLLVALALNNLPRMRGMFRTIYFVPNVVSLTVVAVLFTSLYSPSMGLINYYLGKVGIPAQQFLNSPKQAMESIALMDVWRAVGYYAVIFLAGLQNIPGEYYEAARIDGANGLQQLLRITIPLLNPTIVLCVLLNGIWGFQVFMQPFLMTAGGPLDSTWTPVYLLYRESFQYLRLGYGAAMGLVLTVVILVVTILQRRLVEREIAY
ncbi:MAG: sugar ABC transporter permease [Anaerolineales bacterium]